MDKKGVEELVLAGMSGSLLDQPSEFIESLKEFEAMFDDPQRLESLFPRAECICKCDTRGHRI